MREVFEEVNVQLSPGGTPHLMTWGKRTFRALELLDAWRAGGEWWEGRYPREYYLLAFVGLTAEVYREDRSVRLPGYLPDTHELWVLARIVD